VSSGRRFQTTLHLGDPGEAILRVACELHVDLVVMATQAVVDQVDSCSAASPNRRVLKGAASWGCRKGDRVERRRTQCGPDCQEHTWP
jgi:nucleotide-binding universal stress UspA family protein